MRDRWFDVRGFLMGQGFLRADLDCAAKSVRGDVERSDRGRRTGRSDQQSGLVTRGGGGSRPRYVAVGGGRFSIGQA